MNTLKIATWNVNSLRVRLPHVLNWMETTKPDLLALQETKLIDDDFPLLALQEAGFEAIYVGQKTYNGVALLINKKLNPQKIETHITHLPDFEDPQRRVLGVTIDDLFILNLYVPNGESVESEKYQYKLNWLKKLESFLQYQLKHHPKFIILGDFNIAPADLDVDEPSRWQDKVLCSALERNAFQKLLQAGFHDCFRLLNPTEKHFTWWDYRLNAFKRNLGLRIDHILASHSFAATCVTCYVDKNPRSWERPSDHTPLVAEFNLLSQNT